MEEKKTIKVSLGTVICIFIIIILVIALGVVYYLGFIKTNKESEKVKETNIVENNTTNNQSSNKVKEEILDINSELINNLYGKILKTNLIYNDFNTNGISRQKCSFYKDTKVTADNLSNEEKIIAVLQYLEKNSDKGTTISFANIQSNVLNKMTNYFEGGDYSYCKMYSSKDIAAAKNSIFGEESKINWISIGNNGGYSMDYIDGNYYCYSYPGGGGDWGILSFSQIQKANKDNDYIYIYDKYLYGVLDYGNQDNDWQEVLNFYTNSDMNIKLDSKDNYYNYEDYFYNHNNTIINEYSEKLDTYKHTFKKDSKGDYYWVSTESINN